MLIKIQMHLVHRNKKHTLPIVNDRFNPYYPIIQHSPTDALFSRKKSIDLILEKHQQNINDQILTHYQPIRKTNYHPHRTKKAESGYLKTNNKLQLFDQKLQAKPFPRNKSYQLNTKHQTFYAKKKPDNDYSPYLISQYKKSKSNTKFKSIVETTALNQPPSSPHKDWICMKFIENQVYSVEQYSDFI